MKAFIDYRRSSILEPLGNEDVAFFGYDENIKEKARRIRKLISQERYGSFLIAGDRGSGKSSFVNLVLDDVKKNKDVISIELSTINYRSDDSILYGIVDRLYNHREQFNSSCQEDIESLYKRIKGNFIKREVIENNLSDDTNTKASIRKGTSKEGNIGFIRGFLSGKIALNSEVFNAEEKNNKESSSINRTIEIVEEIELFSETENLLTKLCQEYKVIIVLDELDKQESEYIVDIFNSFKSMFVEKQIITFFVVDSSTYEKYYLDTNSILRTYFLYGVYIPLIEYKDFIKQCYCMYNLNSRREVDKLYFDSMGNRRLANIAYCNRNNGIRLYSEEVFFVSIIDKCLQLRANGLLKYEAEREKLEQDVFIKTIRTMLLKMCDVHGVSMDDLEGIYYDYASKSFPELEDILAVFQSADEYGQIFDISKDQIKIDTRMIRDNDKLEYEDVFTYCDTELSHIRYGRSQDSITPESIIKLGDNEEYAYRNVIKPLALTAGSRLRKAVLIEMQEEGDWPSSETSRSFSFVLAIEDAVGNINAVYNEKGAYRYEGWSIILELLKDLSCLDMNVYYYFHDKKGFNNRDMNTVIKEVLADDNLQIADPSKLFVE